MEVEEREIDEDGNILRTSEKQISEPIPMIRDSSRNRLQRLGALYSDAENLSSPIHRNEARFDENLQQPTPKPEGRNTKRIGKLAALADQINNWEDDSSGPQQSDVKVTNTKSSTKRNAPSPPKIVDASVKKATEVDKGSNNYGTRTKKQTPTKENPKQLQWDQNVMDALQQQGFERRQSSQSKLTYNFKKSSDDNREVPVPKTNASQSDSTATKSPSKADGKTGAKTGISKNLVSNRAAMFESGQKQTTPTKLQKDPAELSIKERLALFEKNKGQALIPKSALGMAPSAKQIMMGGTTGTASFAKDKPSAQPQSTKTSGYNKPGKKSILQRIFKNFISSFFQCSFC